MVLEISFGGAALCPCGDPWEEPDEDLSHDDYVEFLTARTLEATVEGVRITVSPLMDDSGRFVRGKLYARFEGGKDLARRLVSKPDLGHVLRGRTRLLAAQFGATPADDFGPAGDTDLVITVSSSLPRVSLRS